jgi:hypothetical protein
MNPKPAIITVTASKMIATESVVISVFVILEDYVSKKCKGKYCHNLLIAIRLSSVLISYANVNQIIDILKLKTSV